MSGDDVHSDEVPFTGNGITATYYKISRITTIHDYVDITRWGHTQNVLECPAERVYDVLLKGDSVIVRTRQSPNIYRLTSKVLGTYVRIDSSISDYQWCLKYRPAMAPGYLNK